MSRSTDRPVPVDGEVAVDRIVAIDDPDDPRLGDYAALTDAALRKRYEHREGVLIAEGPNPVRELVASRYPVRSLLVSEGRLAAVTDVVAATAATAAPVYVLPQPVLEELVRFRLHQGVLACGERLPLAPLGAVVGGARRLLVLEGLNDHENLGALFRTARAVGVDGVVLGPGCADPLYRRSVRVSMGHVLHVPFARADTTAQALEVLHAAGVTTLALTPDPAAVPIGSVALDDTPTALLLGAEGPGLSPPALGGATHRVRIGMRPEVDSLNVAAAGAIACHVLAQGLGLGGGSPPGGLTAGA